MCVWPKTNTEGRLESECTRRLWKRERLSPATIYLAHPVHLHPNASKTFSELPVNTRTGVTQTHIKSETHTLTQWQQLSWGSLSCWVLRVILAQITGKRVFCADLSGSWGSCHCCFWCADDFMKTALWFILIISISEVWVFQVFLHCVTWAFSETLCHTNIYCYYNVLLLFWSFQLCVTS